MPIINMFICDNCGFTEESSKMQDDTEALITNITCSKFGKRNHKFNKESLTFCDVDCFKKYVAGVDIKIDKQDDTLLKATDDSLDKLFQQQVARHQQKKCDELYEKLLKQKSMSSSPQLTQTSGTAYKK